MRSAGLTCSFSAFMGISEPALFTVQVPNKTPLFGAMLGCGIGGMLTVILGAKCYGFVMPGITSLPVYMDPSGAMGNLLSIAACLVASFCIAAVTSYILTKPIEA